LEEKWELTRGGERILADEIVAVLEEDLAEPAGERWVRDLHRHMDGVVYRRRIVHEAVVHLEEGEPRSEDGALSIQACRASHWTRHRRRIRGDGSRLEPDDCLALALLGRFEVLRDDQNVGIVGWRRVRRRRGVEAEVTSVGQRSAECEYDHR